MSLLLLSLFVIPSVNARVLATVQDITWLPKPSLSQWIAADELPPSDLITAAYAVAGRGREAVVARHRTRGWDITGGHIEPGETPAEAAVRETREEAGVDIGNLRLIAYQRLELQGPKPEGYPHPYPVSYQALFVADILHVGVFKEEEDMVERAIAPCADALSRVNWLRASPALLEYVLQHLGE